MILHRTVVSWCTVLRSAVLCRYRCHPRHTENKELGSTLSLSLRETTTALRYHDDDDSWKCDCFHD